MIGGIGVHLFISHDHFFCMKMGCGQSTNTRSELLALWVLLVISNIFGLPSLHIRGDSSAIINWFNVRAALSALNLDGWCQNIRELESSFLQLDSCHVYREYNVKADGLSKEALTLASTLLLYFKFTESECIGNGTIQLYYLGAGLLHLAHL